MRVVIIPLRYKANVVFLNSELALFALTCCLVLFLFIFWKRGIGFVGQDIENTLTHTETDRETDRERQTESEKDMNVWNGGHGTR